MKLIPGYGGRYSVDEQGRVLSHNYKGKGVEKYLATSPDVNGYPTVGLYDEQRGVTTHKVHRLMGEVFLGIKPGQLLDHRDGNKSNNILSNLRVATARENAQNAKKPKNNRSGFKGVHWCNLRRTWMAKIMANGKRITLGRFNTPEAAGKAYDQAALKHFGTFARPNA